MTEEVPQAIATSLAARNAESWRQVVASYEHDVAQPHLEWFAPLLRLAREITAGDRSARFRAGRSTGRLVISTAPRHGVGTFDPSVHVEVDGTGRLTVEYHNPSRPARATGPLPCGEAEAPAVLDQALERLWADTRVYVRRFEGADLEPLREVFNQIVTAGHAFVYDTPLSAQQMRDYIRSYSAAFVAVRNGRVVGGYVLRPNQPGRGSHVANATYMVAAEVRGYGIGELLGEHSLATARRMGFAAMQFNAVVSSNAGAVRLWERLGFAVVGRVPLAFRDAEGGLVDLLVMHRAV